jgi:hypothetical protein
MDEFNAFVLVVGDGNVLLASFKASERIAKFSADKALVLGDGGGSNDTLAAGAVDAGPSKLNVSVPAVPALLRGTAKESATTPELDEVAVEEEEVNVCINDDGASFLLVSKPDPDPEEEADVEETEADEAFLLSSSDKNVIDFVASDAASDELGPNDGDLQF